MDNKIIFVLNNIGEDVKKMKKFIAFFLILLSLTFGFKLSAYEISKTDKVYVGGEAIGIKLHSGIEVVGTFGVLNDSNIIKPWENTGLREGDYIISLNNINVNEQQVLNS